MDLTTDGDLFADKEKNTPGYFSFIKSNMRAVVASVDIMGSFPLASSVDFEVGVGVGMGLPFGSLTNDWVHEVDGGPLVFGTRHFAACKSVNDGVGCRPQDHASPTPIRVGGYEERGWFRGGSAPSFIPWVSVPQIGTRIRVSDDFAVRVGVGLSVTGIWIGLGGSYVLPAQRRAP